MFRALAFLGLVAALILAAPADARLTAEPRTAFVRTGERLGIVVADRSGQARAVKVCFGPRCRPVRLTARDRRALVKLRAPRPGRRAIVVRAEGQVLARRSILVVRRRARLTLLATGDSMIQIVDSYLGRRAAGLRVRSDAHISTGLSKPFILDWPGYARRQVTRFRPVATVMFIGPNEGFPFGAVSCCGPRWVAEYAKRVRAMMRTYSRGGVARVYWVLLPATRRRSFRPVFRAVNAGIRAGARRAGPGARVIDLGRRITPGGRFRPAVRQRDGIHLNARGASVAADVILRALRADGVR